MVKNSLFGKIHLFSFINYAECGPQSFAVYGPVAIFLPCLSHGLSNKAKSIKPN